MAIKGVILTTYLIWDDLAQYCWSFVGVFFRGSEPRNPEVISNHDFKLVLLSLFWSKVFLSVCLFYWLFQKPQIFSEGVFGISNNQKNKLINKMTHTSMKLSCFRSLWSTRPKYGNIWNAIFNTTHTKHLLPRGGADNILEVTLERVPGRRMPLGFEWQDVSKHDCKVQGGKFFMLVDELMKLMKFEVTFK